MFLYFCSFLFLYTHGTLDLLSLYEMLQTEQKFDLPPPDEICHKYSTFARTHSFNEFRCFLALTNILSKKAHTSNFSVYFPIKKTISLMDDAKSFKFDATIVSVIALKKITLHPTHIEDRYEIKGLLDSSFIQTLKEQPIFSKCSNITGISSQIKLVRENNMLYPIIMNGSERIFVRTPLEDREKVQLRFIKYAVYVEETNPPKLLQTVCFTVIKDENGQITLEPDYRNSGNVLFTIENNPPFSDDLMMQYFERIVGDKENEVPLEEPLPAESSFADTFENEKEEKPITDNDDVLLQKKEKKTKVDIVNDTITKMEAKKYPTSKKILIIVLLASLLGVISGVLIYFCFVKSK